MGSYEYGTLHNTPSGRQSIAIQEVSAIYMSKTN